MPAPVCTPRKWLSENAAGHHGGNRHWISAGPGGSSPWRHLTGDEAQAPSVRWMSGFIAASCEPQYPQPCVPFGGKLKVALRPPSAVYAF